MNIHQALASQPLPDLIALFPRELQPGPLRIFIPAPEGTGASVFPLTVEVQRGDNRQDLARRLQEEALLTMAHREVVEVDLTAMFATGQR
jgi:hypothetical protein